MTPVNVAPYIPQRPPVLVVDSFSECNNSLIITEYKIPQDHIFVQDGHLSSAGLIENIAQTCATRIGWLNRDKPVKIGVIGSVSNLEIFRHRVNGISPNWCNRQRQQFGDIPFTLCRSMLNHQGGRFVGNI
jgi:predicted hotdog family 3-hydroxylacyl-ACP dehydratase